MSNLVIVYYSQTGNVHALAAEAAKTAESAGAEVRLRRARELAPAEAIASNEKWAQHAKATEDIPEASLEDLEWADAIMLGTPTRYGLPTSQLKQFIDMTGPLWEAGKLINKVATSFTSSATSHGGQESTILAINNTFYHWGCIIVGPGYADPIQFDPEVGNPYGASHVGSGGLPSEKTLSGIAFQTKRVLDITDKLVAS